MAESQRAIKGPLRTRHDSMAKEKKVDQRTSAAKGANN